jgi:hypothetical protein
MDVAQAISDAQKIDMVKNVLLNTFVSHYQQIQQFVHQLPIPQNIKDIILKEFDTGYLWGKESMNFLQLAPATPAPPIVQPEPALPIEVHDVKPEVATDGA